MELIRRYRYLLIGIILGAVTVFVVSSVTTDRKLSQLQASLDESIEAAYEEVMVTVAEVENGGRGGAAAAIIADCTAEERDAFESYLVRLDSGLTVRELTETDLLFSRCAPVQSVRRALVSMDFSRRFEKFDALVAQRKQLGSYTHYDTKRAVLKELVSIEDDITQLSFDLVYLQREIIDSLLTGDSVYSERSNDFKNRGVSLRTELTEIAEQALTLRSQLYES